MLGIIILNYNTANDVKLSICSIKKATTICYKIYIVDNCSTDDSLGVLTKLYEQDNSVVIIAANSNGGYSCGNNIGIKAAIADECDYILVSNPDVIYYEHSIDQMFEDITSNGNIGVIGPSCASLDQEESQLIRKTYTKKLYLLSKKPMKYLTAFFPNLKSEYSEDNLKKDLFLFDGMVRGCSFMISAELFSKMGLFDENVFLYSEEWIIAKKLHRLSKVCAFDGKSHILHKEATSTKQNGNGFQSFHLYLSAFYYLKKYLLCNGVELLAVAIFNIVAYSIKSMVTAAYRRLFVKFAKQQIRLLCTNDMKIQYL